MPSSAYVPMRAGRLRRSLTIVQDMITPTADGATSSTTTILATHGSVSARANSTLIAPVAGQAMAQSLYVITLRYPPSVHIAPGMRVLDGAKSYRIHQANDIDERHRMLQLLCLEEPAT